ncbi:MAG: NADP-specific glutamate dehydrogenase [Clostridia bacterium]
MSNYVQRVLAETIDRNPNEPEYHQTATEILHSLEPVFEKHPEWEALGLLERFVEPERVIEFRVPWVNDKGEVKVNKGYRVQFNSAIGPYKGGLRFNPTVNLSIMKFLAFEQTLKNSLTSLPMGGGKGGSDFDPQGKTDAEVMRFCQSFMTELYRHIGPNLDIPAGDLGVGAREIGYMFGQYKRIKNQYENGVLTGKDLSFGGSRIRPEATGFGATYFFNEVCKHEGLELSKLRFALSGFGNVAWGAAKKITELGGKVVSISSLDGYCYIKDGLTMEMVDFMPVMNSWRHNLVKEFKDKFPQVEFVAGKKPWGNVDADVYMPCATQNEIRIDDAKAIVAKGIKYLNEVSNMPTTNEALEYLQAHNVLVCPSKAVNAGGVATSGLEMSQNSMRLAWDGEEVDEKLHTIMRNIHNQILQATIEYKLGYNLVAGANIAGFDKVAKAMIAQGIV